MPETFVISDTHLHHYNTSLHGNRSEFLYPNPNYNPDIPDHFKKNNPKCVDLELHDNTIIEGWNDVITKKDNVWILGDLAWKKHTEFILRLNGKKRLIRGNHDKMHQDAYKMFTQIEGAHYRYSYYTKIHGQMVMLSHCPYQTWFSSCHGSWHLHGHCHGRLKEVPGMLAIDCGWDVWRGPIPWDIIVARMRDKEIIRKDYFDNRNRLELDESNDHATINRDINMRYMRGETGIING
jgi:calcineurin-like phosphoesterase family protein